MTVACGCAACTAAGVLQHGKACVLLLGPFHRWLGRGYAQGHSVSRCSFMFGIWCSCCACILHFCCLSPTHRVCGWVCLLGLHLRIDPQMTLRPDWRALVLAAVTAVTPLLHCLACTAKSIAYRCALCMEGHVEEGRHCCGRGDKRLGRVQCIQGKLWVAYAWRRL